MKLVISYDMISDRRRTKMFTLLKNYGDPIQYSVFECDLTRKQLDQLRQRLKTLIHEKEGDTICIYHLCADCARQVDRVGGRLAREKGSVIL